MYLKSIAVKGFKSFPERTRLLFAPGVSVVVGPNGSGKSNITDAVLWALGEQSPLAVRGQSMQDVIFSGGKGRAQSRVAEVEVTIDNSDGAAACEFAEISIQRRLDRSGEGEYRLNGARCRLIDVIEALSDTGLGKEMHSVVSQGRVEEIVHSRPRDRRLLIEEAAGLGKHRKRRRRAQLKLERTQENLDRSLDVEREARSRLRPLKRQAEAADLHERLERQALELGARLAAEELRAVAAELAGAEDAARSARSARDGIEERLAAVAHRREAAEQRFADRDRERQALAHALVALQVAHERLGLRGEALEARRAELAAGLESRRRAQAALGEAGGGGGGADGEDGETALERELGAVEAALAEAGAALAAARRVAEPSERAAALAGLRRAAERAAGAGRRAEALAGRSRDGSPERRIAAERELGDRIAAAGRAIEAARAAAGERAAALERRAVGDEAAGEATAAELRACAQQEYGLQAELRGAAEAVTGAEVGAAQLRDRHAEVAAELERIGARLGFEPEPAAEPLPGAERAELERKIERLAHRREQLGPVNPLAASEYGEARAHVEDLEAQRADLEAALAELGGLIRETDRKIRQAFEETFEATAAHFEELVAHLFPGGRGRLRLVAPEGPRPVLGGFEPPPETDGEPPWAAGEAAGGEGDGDESGAGYGEAPDEQAPGVEVEVTPAGKATKRLSLLSGGEKSLVALAFMFAVFLARPCPFYILDEVEAALDDANIDRFLQLLRRYSDRAQFIVVTHQKRTMDAADVLYGATMGDDGVTKIVSRRLPREEQEGLDGEDLAPDVRPGRRGSAGARAA